MKSTSESGLPVPDTHCGKTRDTSSIEANSSQIPSLKGEGENYPLGRSTDSPRGLWGSLEIQEDPRESASKLFKLLFLCSVAMKIILIDSRDIYGEKMELSNNASDIDGFCRALLSHTYSHAKNAAEISRAQDRIDSVVFREATSSNSKMPRSMSHLYKSPKSRNSGKEMKDGDKASTNKTKSKRGRKELDSTMEDCSFVREYKLQKESTSFSANATSSDIENKDEVTNQTSDTSSEFTSCEQIGNSIESVEKSAEDIMREIDQITSDSGDSLGSTSISKRSTPLKSIEAMDCSSSGDTLIEPPSFLKNFYGQAAERARRELYTSTEENADDSQKAFNEKIDSGKTEDDVKLNR